jgi:hypothetical protein
MEMVLSLVIEQQMLTCNFSLFLPSQTRFNFLNIFDAVEAPLLGLVLQIPHNFYMMMMNTVKCFCQVSFR